MKRRKAQDELVPEHAPEVVHEAPEEDHEAPEVIHEALEVEELTIEVSTEMNDEKCEDPALDKSCQTETESPSAAGAPLHVVLSESPSAAGAPSNVVLSLDRLKNNREMMQYYTGLDDFDQFIYAFQSLGPASTDLKYKSSLGPKNEFLLTLIKLRQDKDDIELGFLFGVSQPTAGRIFKNWLNFMYYQFKEIELFQDKDTVQEYMPEGFKNQFPKTRIILDGTEVPIEKPSNVADQRSTWSQYKHTNTLKVVAGISPRGVTTFVSHAYGGSASDREIIEKELLDGRFESGDSIMADRGMLVQDLFATQNVQVNTPTTMKGVNQLPAETVVKDRRIASKRVHVERVIGLAKTYKILANELDHSKVPLGGRIIFVCFMLSNFRKNIMARYS